MIPISGKIVATWGEIVIGRGYEESSWGASHVYTDYTIFELYILILYIFLKVHYI